MALESGTYISDLNPSNPVGATDKVSTLDDHVRLIKSTLQNTFPNIDGEVSATEDELNYLHGVTGTTGTGKLVLDDAPTIADLTVSGTEFEVNADLLDFNGDADISGTLAVGGTISGNGSGLTNLNASNLSSGTVPSARLPATIGGNKTFSDNVAVSGAVTVSGASRFESTARDVSAPAVRIGESGSTIQPAVLSIVRAGNPNLVLHNLNSGAEALFQVGTSVIIGAETAHPLQFRTNATARMSIDAAGDVSMTGALSVDGAVRAGTAATSTSSTLAAGQIHHRSENTTVPSMNAGQWVAVQNTGTSSITLSQGSGVTLELGGTTITGNRTLLAKGFAFIYFRANGVGVVHGSGVT